MLIGGINSTEELSPFVSSMILLEVLSNLYTNTVVFIASRNAIMLLINALICEYDSLTLILTVRLRGK